jgi:transcriptional regulator with XRE-family HTH domain
MMFRRWSMSQPAKRRPDVDSDPVRVLGRGLRAQRGVHLTLRAVREAAGRTQVEVREASGIDQSDISRLEGRETLEDSQVSTLQRYVAALGGRLDVVAVFGDKKIILTGVGKVAQESSVGVAAARTGRRSARG